MYQARPAACDGNLPGPPAGKAEAVKGNWLPVLDWQLATYDWQLFVTAIDKCGQATKGVRWMSWHREATKDVVACDKPREAGKQAVIRGFLNEETRREQSRHAHLNV